MRVSLASPTPPYRSYTPSLPPTYLNTVPTHCCALGLDCMASCTVCQLLSYCWHLRPSNPDPPPSTPALPAGRHRFRLRHPALVGVGFLYVRGCGRRPAATVGGDGVCHRRSAGCTAGLPHGGLQDRGCGDRHFPCSHDGGQRGTREGRHASGPLRLPSSQLPTYLTISMNASRWAGWGAFHQYFCSRTSPPPVCSCRSSRPPAPRP